MFASPKSLASIRTYGGLLWATSTTDEEADFYCRKLEDFRWSLKVRAKGAAFVTAAIREMEESLQELDVCSRPAPGKVEAEWNRIVMAEPTPQYTSTNSIISDAVDVIHAAPREALTGVYQDNPYGPLEYHFANLDAPQAFMNGMSGSGLFYFDMSRH